MSARWEGTPRVASCQESAIRDPREIGGWLRGCGKKLSKFSVMTVKAGRRPHRVGDGSLPARCKERSQRALPEDCHI